MALIQVSREDSAFINNLNIARDNVCELLDDCNKLRDTFSDSDEELFEIVNDHIKLSRILEKLFALGDVIYCVQVFCITYVFCKEKASNNEENKVVGEMSFEVTKNFRMSVKEKLLESVDTLLDISKQWKFDDYRCRNFQDDLRDEMKDFREVIVNFLDSE